MNLPDDCGPPPPPAAALGSTDADAGAAELAQAHAVQNAEALLAAADHIAIATAVFVRDADAQQQPPAVTIKKEPKDSKPTVIACMACARMKMRCDGLRPCARCIRVDRECVDRAPGEVPRAPKRRKEDPSDSPTPAGSMHRASPSNIPGGLSSTIRKVFGASGGTRESTNIEDDEEAGLQLPPPPPGNPGEGELPTLDQTWYVREDRTSDQASGGGGGGGRKKKRPFDGTVQQQPASSGRVALNWGAVFQSKDTCPASGAGSQPFGRPPREQRREAPFARMQRRLRLCFATYYTQFPPPPRPAASQALSQTHPFGLEPLGGAHRTGDDDSVAPASSSSSARSHSVPPLSPDDAPRFAVEEAVSQRGRHVQPHKNPDFIYTVDDEAPKPGGSASQKQRQKKKEEEEGSAWLADPLTLGNLPRVQALLQAGESAALALPEPCGCTPLGLILRHRTVRRLSMESVTDLGRLLLKHGADPNKADKRAAQKSQKDKDGGCGSLLELAVEAEAMPLFAEMVEHGARVEEVGQACLWRAILVCQRRVDAIGSPDLTLLHRLLAYSSRSSSEVLASNGKKFLINATPDLSSRPLNASSTQFAIRQRAPSILATLLQYGAVPDVHVDLWPPPRRRELQGENDFPEHDVALAASIGVGGGGKGGGSQEAKAASVKMLQLLLARGATVPPGLEKRKSVKDARLAMSWGGRAEEKGKSKGKAARQVGEKGSVVALKVLAGAAAMRRAGGDEDKVPETAREVLQSIASEEDGAREGDGGGAEEEEKAAQEAPKTGVKDDGYNVGCRVEVYFDDGLWYEGEIVALDAAKGVHSIFFLDGDRQDIALPDPDVRLLT